MKKTALAAAALGAVTISALAAAVVGSGPGDGTASSHREAPLISEDPSADNTDLYAFRSPDRPDSVTIVSNWIPGEDPAAELLHVLAVRPLQHLHRPQRRRAAGHHLPLPLSADARAALPRQHGAEVLGHEDRGREDPAADVGDHASEQHRPECDAEIP